jgi:putative DNA primase/helicase
MRNEFAQKVLGEVDIVQLISEDARMARRANMTDEEKINLVKEIFRGRSDAYGAGECVKEPVTDAIIKAHLTGKRRIGRYPLSPDILDGAGTWWVVVDIDMILLFIVDVSFQDNFDNGIISDELRQKFEKEGILLTNDTNIEVEAKHTKWVLNDNGNKTAYWVRKERNKLNICGEADINLAIQFRDILEHIEIPCYVERSKKKGSHVWVFFSEPVEAKGARALMRYGIEILERDTGYRIKEIFPKQNTIKNADGSFGFGNYINLPLFGESVKDERTVFLDSNKGYKPHPDQWSFLASIKRVTPDKLEELIELGELEPEQEAQPEPETEPVEPGGDTTEDYADMLPCVKKMMAGVDEGCRDVVAFTLAKHFRVEKKLPADATLAILRIWNQKNAPPLTDKELQTKVKSSYTGKGGKGYTSLGCDVDLIQQFCEKESCPVFQKKENPYFIGNIFIPKRLADELMEENRFIFSGEQLHIYTDGVYVPNGERFVRQQCRKKLGDAARVHRLNEVIAHISDMTYVETEELNTHTNLINLQNGMYNWIEEKFLPHNPKYLSTIRIPVEYNPKATCPTVDYFFESTLPSDCISIAEEFFGLVLIPYVGFEKAFMLTGIGRNGKSTFLTLLEKFVGSENVSKIPLQELDENRFKRAELFGKLVNLFADLDARALESSSYFKTVVSGDAIDAERKHKNPFFFRPFARLAYSANQLPYSYDKSLAYYARWIIMPFPHRFEGKKADKSLRYKLTRANELSGLLNRALTGLNRLFENQDFTESETVKDAVDDYQKQNDTIAAFINECCEFGEGFEIERSKLYDAYATYCQKAGFEADSRIACYNRIRANSPVGEKKEPNARYFIGVKVRESQ